jgi:hypothetical protein
VERQKLLFKLFANVALTDMETPEALLKALPHSLLLAYLTEKSSLPIPCIEKMWDTIVVHAEAGIRYHGVTSSIPPSNPQSIKIGQYAIWQLCNS